MNPRSILQNNDVFPEPTEFRPERWLVPTGGDEGAGMKRKLELERFFVAFGKGGRMCLGMGFAMTELHITLATIFRRFDFELYGTTREKDIDTARDCFLAETLPGSLGVRVKVVEIFEE
jgi:cytochrome P450